MHRTRLWRRQLNHRTAIVAAAVALAIGLPAVELPRAAAEGADSGVISREYKLKAAFLYNFGRYVQWPSEAFRDAQAPFVIGVVGPSPVIPELHRIAKTKKIQERPIQIRQFPEAKEVEGCHILFLPAAVEPESRVKTIERCSRKAVLLVGESRDFLDQGGVMNFVIEQNRIRVHVAPKTAKRQKLAISSKLLQVAQIVH